MHGNKRLVAASPVPYLISKWLMQRIGGKTVSQSKNVTGNNDLAIQNSLETSRGNTVVAIISGIALLFSAYSLWETSLKSADLKMFVPSVIEYSAPYNNSNFEMISIPVTLINDGAQTGTVLHLNLDVTDPRTNKTKRFYSADFGVWSMERTRQRAYTSFSPLSLQGKATRSESILFYTRGPKEEPQQLIRATGPYEFKLTVVEARAEGPLAWLSGLFGPKEPVSVSFTRELPFYDARAFNDGTISMHSPDWAPSGSGSKNKSE